MSLLARLSISRDRTTNFFRELLALDLLMYKMFFKRKESFTKLAMQASLAVSIMAGSDMSSESPDGPASNLFLVCHRRPS